MIERWREPDTGRRGTIGRRRIGTETGIWIEIASDCKWFTWMNLSYVIRSWKHSRLRTNLRVERRMAYESRAGPWTSLCTRWHPVWKVFESNLSKYWKKGQQSTESGLHWIRNLTCYQQPWNHIVLDDRKSGCKQCYLSRIFSDLSFFSMSHHITCCMNHA